MIGGDETRTCTWVAPASKSIWTIWRVVLPADDRVVDDDYALSGNFRERVELEADALLPERLVGLDERAADVAVLDQPLAEGDPGRAREPDRRRRARVGDGEDEVGLGGRLGGELLADPDARAVHLDALEQGVGARG